MAKFQNFEMDLITNYAELEGDDPWLDGWSGQVRVQCSSPAGCMDPCRSVALIN